MTNHRWKTVISKIALTTACVITSIPLVSGCGGGSISISHNPDKRCVVQTPAKGDVVKAVVNDQFMCVKDLAHAGADLNENLGDDKDAVTPLLAAVTLQRQDIANFLIERGAALHPMFNGYRAKDFALHIYGDYAQLTRTLGRLQRPETKKK